MFVPVLCPDSLWLLFYNSKYQALAAAPKTRLSDGTGFTTARSIKLWLLKLLPDLQWSHWLVLLYLICSPAKLCPGLTLTILLFSSRLPFPTVWTLTSALLISVLSINVTPLIILHLGLSLVNWCDKTLTNFSMVRQKKNLSSHLCDQLKVSLWFNNRHTLVSWVISWSKPIRDSDLASAPRVWDV